MVASASGTSTAPQEWAVHDCYSRIGILYFFSHWMTSVWKPRRTRTPGQKKRGVAKNRTWQTWLIDCLCYVILHINCFAIDVLLVNMVTLLFFSVKNKPSCWSQNHLKPFSWIILGISTYFNVIRIPNWGQQLGQLSQCIGWSAKPLAR